MSSLKSFLILVLVSCLAACSSVPHKIYPPIITKKLKLPQPRVALILGSGGAKGFAHLGVLQALEEAHIPVDLIIGASAGSIIGGLYAAQPCSSRLIQVMMRSHYDDFLDIAVHHWLRGAILGNKLQRFIAKNSCGKSIEELKIPFIAVATDLDTGNTISLTHGPLPLAVNASCAVPVIMHPVVCENVTLVDGGLSDPLPVDIAKQYHPKLTIAVDISSKHVGRLPLTLNAIAVQSIDILILSLTKKSMKNADVVIRPDVGNGSMFDLSTKEMLYLKGLYAGRKAIPRIKQLLNAR